MSACATRRMIIRRDVPTGVFMTISHGDGECGWEWEVGLPGCTLRQSSRRCGVAVAVRDARRAFLNEIEISCWLSSLEHGAGI